MARPARRPGNLPAEATSFVGRRRELADLRTRLAEARLISLVGLGGVGKTRLALRAAADLRRRFPHGAWWVELAEVRDPALVGNAVLAALDLRDQAATDPVVLLLSYLRDKRLLLVVDNCEHVLASTARLLTQVMRAAPGVHVIATSREPLSVPGEHVVRVPPLELPPAHTSTPLPQLRQNEAVMLLAARAAAGSGGFEVTTANRAAVAQLCRRLDGLPLAIELAAVRTRVLTVQQILDRVTDRFGLLTGGSPVALPRHQTLRTTIDWSHDLLTGGEQTLLRRLGAFAGRFTLDDVEGVCAFDDVPAAEVLDLLASLVDKSLVLKEDVGDVACYRLHETMREYSGLKAREAGEQDVVEQRCADYYLASSLRASVDARYRLVEWLEWLDLEIDNIRSVLRWCLARGDGRRGLDLATAIGWYWITRATTEGVRWLDELLAVEADSTKIDPLTHFLRGFLAVLQFDPAVASPALDRAVAAAREAGRAGVQSMSLSMAAIARGMSDDHVSAGCLLDAAHELATGLDDFPATVSVLQARALGGLFVSDLDAVRSAASEGARLSRQVGDLYSLEMMLLNLGLTALVAGDLDGSWPPLAEALRIARRLDDRIAQYGLLDSLGRHAADSGRPQLAAQLLGAAETVRAGVGASVLPYLLPLVAQATESTTAVLGTQAFRAEFDTGRRMDRDEAIALALGEPAPATLPASGAVGPGPLGRREAEVARLVADGLSNKQIGARLLISEHTVDTHVRNILNKLGFNSRAQIAAWMASPAP
jgi:predicted ATPase/DNA-binding CsgD family transcriptional regulator